mmetsp:Transcript_10612/g.15765  ORF Transcript_10612/g.15765 Transcript_10612/m.15765 type:complete len:83 (+) Transcript_10612:52-300(+)
MLVLLPKTLNTASLNGVYQENTRLQAKNRALFGCFLAPWYSETFITYVHVLKMMGAMRKDRLLGMFHWILLVVCALGPKHFL